MGVFLRFLQSTLVNSKALQAIRGIVDRSADHAEEARWPDKTRRRLELPSHPS